MRRRWATAGFTVFLLAACGGEDGVPLTAGDGGDGSTNPDGGAKPDGSVNPDGSINPDGSVNPDGGTVSIQCGQALTCLAPSSTCCVDVNNPPQYKCSGGDAGACAQGAVSLSCASAVDCPSSQVCCVDATNQNAPVTSCQTTCGGVDHAVVCNPTGTAQANRCGDAGACGNGNIDTWGLTNLFGTCGNTTGPL